MAALAGADYVAPYVNRLDNISSHGIEVVGHIVENIKDADTIFSLDKGITPFDVDIIISEYIK